MSFHSMHLTMTSSRLLLRLNCSFTFNITSLVEWTIIIFIIGRLKPLRELHKLYQDELNLWTGILANHIVGPFFFVDTLTEEYYLCLLEEHINNMNTVILENDDELDENLVTFR